MLCALPRASGARRVSHASRRREGLDADFQVRVSSTVKHGACFAFESSVVVSFRFAAAVQASGVYWGRSEMVRGWGIPRRYTAVWRSIWRKAS